MDILLSSGYEAYLVGGCVRDLLLGLKPYDYDIATNLHPRQVLELFSSKGYKAIPTGIQYGTVTVVVGDMQVEVTTYRSEVYVEGRGRKPVVSYASTLYEDVWRRDFTVNALAMDREGNIVDYVGGLRDLEDKVIRFVGEPYERIREDPLRILRALRLSAKLGFKVEENSLNAIKRYSYMLDEISWERRRDEVLKAGATTRFKDFVELLYETKVYGYVIPELGFADRKQLFPSLQRADRKGFNPYVKFAVLYYHIYRSASEHPYKYRGMPRHIISNSLRRLRFSSIEVQRITIVIEGTSKLVDLGDKSTEKLGIEAFLVVGDSGGDVLRVAYSVTGREEFLKALRVFERVRERHRKPLIDGEMIMMLYDDYNPGKWIGVVKRRLYDLQVRYDVTDVNTLIGLALGRIIPSSKFERFLTRIAESIREEYWDDIEAYLRGDTPKNDSIEVNKRVVEALKSLGISAELVRLPSIKHWIVRLKLGHKTYYVDAVPEYSGVMNEELLGVPVVYKGSISSLEELYLGVRGARAIGQLVKTV